MMIRCGTPAIVSVLAASCRRSWNRRFAARGPPLAARRTGRVPWGRTPGTRAPLRSEASGVTPPPPPRATTTFIPRRCARPRAWRSRPGQPPHRRGQVDHGNGDRVPGQHWPGPGQRGPTAEIPGLNGYGTAAFGKWHETVSWEASISGLFDRWPTRQGFDAFYGFSPTTRRIQLGDGQNRAEVYAARFPRRWLGQRWTPAFSKRPPEISISGQRPRGRILRMGRTRCPLWPGTRSRPPLKGQRVRAVQPALVRRAHGAMGSDGSRSRSQ